MRRNAFLILVMLLSSLTCDDMVGDIKGVKDKNNLIILSRLISEAGIDGIVYPSYVCSHWKFDETSGYVVDIKGGYNLSEHGTVPSTTGKFDNARGVYSLSNYFTWSAGGSNSTVFDNSTFAVEFWFKISPGANYEWIINKRSAGFGWSVTFGSGATGQIGLTMEANSFFSSPDWDDNNWHYAVCAQIATSGPNNRRIYIDNSVQGQAAGYDYDDPSTNDLYVGKASDSSEPLESGHIDDIVYWNTVPATWIELEEVINKRWNNGNGRRYISAP